jgi:hypothetical protein
MSQNFSKPTKLGKTFSYTDPVNALTKQFYQWGTYVVKNTGDNEDKKYFNKSAAIMEAQKHEHAWVEFNFHDDTFANSNPMVEPDEDLLELYRQRAQQLRDEYDYLVLSYSSGCDSTNILHAFLHNDIKLDEIFCYGPFSTQQGRTWQHDPLNRNRMGEKYELLKTSANNYREIDLVAIPYLKELSKTYDFKLTLYDWTDDLVDSFTDQDWVWHETRCRLAPSCFARNRLHNARQHLDLVDKGKKVAFIYGIDKPRVILKDNQWYFSFLDIMFDMGAGPSAIATGQHWEHDEFFYWTPDMPEITIKQAHMIKRYVEEHPETLPYVADADNAEWNTPYADLYYDMIKRIIYPTYNHDTWQTKKPTSATYTDHDYWFINSDLPAKRHWLAGLDELTRNIDSKFFNGGDVANGYVCHWSKWHKFGNFQTTEELNDTKDDE